VRLVLQEFFFVRPAFCINELTIDLVYVRKLNPLLDLFFPIINATLKSLPNLGSIKGAITCTISELN